MCLLGAGLGPLSDLPRKNCWTIAEWAGEATPDGMQHLLNRAKWDADAVRDGLRDYVAEHLHDDRAVLVVDETGDVKWPLVTSAVSDLLAAARPTAENGCRAHRRAGTGSRQLSETGNTLMTSGIS